MLTSRLGPCLTCVFLFAFLNFHLHLLHFIISSVTSFFHHVFRTYSCFYEDCESILHFPETVRQVKVKVSLCLTKHYAVKTYGGVGIWMHIFGISWPVVSFAPRPLYLRGKCPWCTLDRLDEPRNQSGRLEDKICSRWDSNFVPSVVQPL
jgi:hypothetical protein